MNESSVPRARRKVKRSVAECEVCQGFFVNATLEQHMRTCRLNMDGCMLNMFPELRKHLDKCHRAEWTLLRLKYPEW